MIAMKKRTVNPMIRSAIILFCLVGLFSCSNQTPGPDKLEQRVKALWDAKKNKDLKTIYQLHEKSFREKTTEEKFLKKRPIDVIDYEFQKVELTDEGRSGKSFVKMKIKGMGGFVFEPMVSDVWVVEDGEWYLKYMPPKNLFENARPKTADSPQ